MEGVLTEVEIERVSDKPERLQLLSPVLNSCVSTWPTSSCTIFLMRTFLSLSSWSMRARALQVQKSTLSTTRTRYAYCNYSCCYYRCISLYLCCSVSVALSLLLCLSVVLPLCPSLYLCSDGRQVLDIKLTRRGYHFFPPVLSAARFFPEEASWSAAAA